MPATSARMPSTEEYERAARKVWEVACRPLFGGGREPAAASRASAIVNRAGPAGSTGPSDTSRVSAIVNRAGQASANTGHAGPAGSIAPPPTQRIALVQSASGEYDSEAQHLIVLCSRKSWVQDAFRQRGLPLPTEDELRGLPLDTAPGQPHATSFCSAADRVALILSASREYDAEHQHLIVLCSRSAWVQDAFRQRGLPLPTDDELRGLPLDTAPGQPHATSFCSPVDRATLILSASCEFDAEHERLVVLCSRKSWVQDAFRRRGLPLPSDTELHGLPVD